MTLGRALRPGRITGVVGLALFLVFSAASPAWAHATLLQTDPAPGAVLQQSPSAITLNFDSTVSAALGAIRVYSGDGTRVDNGRVEVSGATVRLPLPRLKSGAFVVTWRVTSSDTHPVGGAFTFQIGTTANATSPAVVHLAQRLLGSQAGDQLVGVLYGAARWLVFAGLALFLGAASFGLMVWPAARHSRRARRLVWGGWTALLIATVVSFGLYGPYAAGLSISSTTRLSLIGDTFGVRFGELAAARILLLLLAVPLLRSLFGNRAHATDARSARGVLFAAVALLLAATPGLAAHAVTGRWIAWAVGADALHVLAMAVWLGGLLVLAAVLLPRRDLGELRAVLPRWSRVAAVCLTVIVATGVFQAYRQIGGLAELRSTDYGRLLIVKVLVFSFMLPLAAFGREIVLQLAPPPRRGRTRRAAVVAGGSDDDLPTQDVEPAETQHIRRLRLSVWVEVGIGAAVLAVTALLVNAPPARKAAAVSAATQGGQVTVAMKSSQARVEVTVTPAKPGQNDVRVTTEGPGGTPEDFQGLRLTLDLPSKNIAPIAVPMSRIATGDYLATSFAIPISGSWRVTAYPLLSEFDEVTMTGTLKLNSS
ncbi:MAG TPA: copper resistance protein CopC [Acidimicrobiales bacterium]